MSLLAYDRILHALSGLYIWEWIQSCSDDRKYLTSSKRSWAMTFNFVNRYLLLFGIIASLAEFDISQSESTNCRAWHTATLTFLLGSIVLANLAFALKVITAWNRRNYITVPIIVLFIGTTMFFFACETT
ncbi:hypothetical protein ONZ45_g12936 [Pleurotus djamor]|nr:hypothetical protein ONZ45_g12936 [Pleurotus djamor]